ncbi:MAG: Txe/YoeB family addiction module toxin [Gemmatimonadaceae bacterium]
MGARKAGRANAPTLRVCQLDSHCLEDLRWRAGTNRKSALRALALIEAVLRDPFAGVGKPEPLKGLAPNTWSRRITDEHRLVYVVFDDRVVFVQARYHY